MIKKQTNQYETPGITVYTVHVNRPIADSADGSYHDPFETDGTYNDGNPIL